MSSYPSSPQGRTGAQPEASYALFRLPHERSFTRLVQHSGKPRTFQELTEVPSSGGYLIVPFTVTPSSPIVLIEPDFATEEDLPMLGNSRTDIETSDSELRREHYAASFAQVHGSILQGHTDKVVLSRRLHLQFAQGLADAKSLFFKACRYCPNSMVTLWHTPDTGTWLVASPEPLLEYAHHTWGTVALAGTMPLAAEPAQTVWSDKNVEEQAIVARFIRSQLDEVATSVLQSATYTLPTGQLQHLCTDFRFSLNDDGDALQLLRRLHPTPAVCGQPREEARQLILSAEDAPRRYYAGFSGPFLWQGMTHLFVSLRCMEFSAHEATLYAGGGVMPDSIEQEEWEETCRKMQPMLQLFG